MAKMSGQALELAMKAEEVRLAATQAAKAAAEGAVSKSHAQKEMDEADVVENLAARRAESAVATSEKVLERMQQDKSDALHRLYATQLRGVFLSLFNERHSRPVIGLLNCCLSGGNLAFMRRPAVRALEGTDTWPLFLCSSAQADKDALVDGMWSPWFSLLTAAVRDEVGARQTALADMAERAVELYFHTNVYALIDRVKTLITARRVVELDFHDTGGDPWHKDLLAALREIGSGAAPLDSPAWEAISTLQRRYESGQAYFRIAPPVPPHVFELPGVARDADGGAVVW